MTPFSTSPHWQDFGSAILTLGNGELALGVEARIGVRESSRRNDRSSRVRAIRRIRAARRRCPTAFSAGELPASGTMRAYWFSISQRSSLICLQHHPDRLQNIERLEAGDDHRLLVVPGDELVGRGPDHHGDMAGSEKAVEMQVGTVEDRLDRRDDRDVIAEHREIARCPRAPPAAR